MHYLTLLILSFASTVHSSTPRIVFTHQSQQTSFPQWFEMFTLCLAPLVAHIAGGVSVNTLLGSPSQSPSWIARIPHFNPISIMWRYYAIADRRLRARDWDERDMAACNAVFWDGERCRWDGSEEIMVRSRAWITRKPERSHVPFVSASSVITAVMALQGAQACFLIIATMVTTTTFGYGLPYLFLPLGCLGLLRLPAAFWISSDYGYSNTLEEEGRCDVAGNSIGVVSDRLFDARSLRGRVYRVWWFFTVVGLLGLSAVACTKIWWSHLHIVYLSVSRLLFQVLYFFAAIVGMFIHCVYVLRGRTDTTVIPCIHSAWYKIFTMILMAGAFVLVMITALESRRLPDGTITTLPGFW
ncbi:MAG: hypothetical protein M1813_000569 [Trichoglossum hirsutum]|nr:MAG: hypothetical protein M1813_000569 [Trichoglossum hirsutum]